MIVAYDPSYEIAGIRTARYDHLRCIGPAFGRGLIERGKHIAGRAGAPVVDVGAQEIEPVTAAAAGIAIHYPITLAAKELEFMPHAGLARSPHGRGASVYVEHHGIFMAGLVIGRF